MQTRTQAQPQRTATPATTAVATAMYLWAVDSTTYASWDVSTRLLRHGTSAATTAQQLASKIAKVWQVQAPRVGRRRVRVWAWPSVIPPTADDLAAHAAAVPGRRHHRDPDPELTMTTALAGVTDLIARVDAETDEPAQCETENRHPGTDPDDDGKIVCTGCHVVLDVIGE